MVRRSCGQGWEFSCSTESSNSQNLFGSPCSADKTGDCTRASCEHNCTDIADGGGFYCSCGDGMKVTEDRTGCEGEKNRFCIKIYQEWEMSLL